MRKKETSKKIDIKDIERVINSYRIIRQKEAFSEYKHYDQWKRLGENNLKYCILTLAENIKNSKKTEFKRNFKRLYCSCECLRETFEKT